MDFIKKCIDYVKANPLHGIIAAALAVFVVVLLIVIVSLSVKRSKTKKKLAAEQAAKNKLISEEQAKKEKALKEAEEKAKAAAARKAVEEKLEAQRLAAEKEEAEKKAAAEKIAAEKEEAEKKAAAEKAVAEKAAKEIAASQQVPEEEPQTEETTQTPQIKATREAKEEKAATKKSAEKNAQEKSEKKSVQSAKAVNAQKQEESVMLYDELKDVAEEDDVWYEEDETDKAARYKGKWLICRMVTDEADTNDEMYFFELHASNGEKLLSSEEYTSYNGALRGIATHKANIEKGNFKITLSKKGDYIFKLLSGKNMLLCMGENYPTRARCESAIESTKRFAKTAVIDENVQDQVVKVPIEDNAEIAPLPENCNGKWVIMNEKGADGEEVFYFELFANNGEKLLSSEEYTTYIGAVNGIATHKANIEKGNFRISLTKRGDYIYKLLNGNGQLLCLGEHYKTKRLCQNAVESVKRFAKNSPVLTDATLKE